MRPEPKRSWAAGKRSERYAWWVVGLLAFGLMLSLLDRMVIALMIGPIERDLRLTDTQVSLLQGLAFTIFYVIAGIPLGRLADRWSRGKLAAGSVIAWSAMTMACGYTTSFWQFFVARLGVGVGEAGLAPSAVSLISDYFPKERRARPLAFMTIGSTAGAGLAMMVGGAVVHAVGVQTAIRLPVVGSVRPWQAVFLILGIVGALFGTAFLTVREPIRQDMSSQTQGGFSQVLGFMRRRWRFFLAQFLGPSLSVMTLVSFHSWIPTLFIRRFGWDPGSTGLAYGLCIGLGGLTGVLSSGWIAERLVATRATGAPLHVAFWAALSAVVPAVLCPLATSPALLLSMLFLSSTLLTIPSTLAPAVLQSVCPNGYRGQVFAIYLLVLSILSYTIAPLSVAVITDVILRNKQELNISIAIVASVCVPLCAISLGFARRAFNDLSFPS